jgi:hypothetical protein
VTELVIALAGLAGTLFGAGVAWGILRSGLQGVRKDLNGLGLKVRDGEKQNARHQGNVDRAILTMCPEEKRVNIAQLLKD